MKRTILMLTSALVLSTAIVWIASAWDVDWADVGPGANSYFYNIGTDMTDDGLIYIDTTGMTDAEENEIRTYCEINIDLVESGHFDHNGSISLGSHLFEDVEWLGGNLINQITFNILDNGGSICPTVFQFFVIP